MTIRRTIVSASLTMSSSSSFSSSRIPEMYKRFRSTVNQLDELESRIANRVASLRRRATHLVEEVPTHRRSHMRIFISHRLQEGEDEKDNKKVTVGSSSDGAAVPPASSAAAAAAAAASSGQQQPALKPGGGKDFGNLLNSSAHENAERQQAAAEEARRKASADASAAAVDRPKKGIRRWTLVLEGGLLIKHLDHVSAKEVDRRLENGLPILGCMQDTDDDDDTNGGLKRGEALKREPWTGGGAERQDEKVIDPLIFTHLFDNLEVELSIVKKSKKTEVAPPSTKKTYTWERSKANSPPDSNAFFIVHDEEHEFKPMGGKVFKSEFNVDHIDAKIKLFRRQGDEENFIPTPTMCELFFPPFIGLKSEGDMKSKDKSKKSKKRKLTLSVSSASLDKKANNSTQSSWMDPSNNAGGGAVNNNDVATGVAPIGEAPPQVKLEEKEGVPNIITMDEAVAAVFFYVRTRGLQDPQDASIINNDEQLSKLFGCNRMLLSAVRTLLIQRGLLVKVEPCTHPIIFNYAMTPDGKEPLEPKKPDVAPEKNDDAKSGRRRTSTVEKSASAEEEEEEEAPVQTMLSCDVDVQVPNLYHNRSKDVLRRIKNREFEYTSARTRALRSLLATFVHEETSKQVLGDAARGRGYAPYHKKAWMALAQGSVEGGEAQKAAMIDLRTTSLVEKLEERCSMTQGFASVVQSCKGLGDEKEL